MIPWKVNNKSKVCIWKLAVSMWVERKKEPVWEVNEEDGGRKIAQAPKDGLILFNLTLK
jgi:hypothetical protein